MSAARKILLDTDAGSDVDDTLALGVVIAEPEAIDLVGITTIGKHGDVRAKVTASLLGLAGRDDVVTAIGAERPLARDDGFFNWFDHEKACIAEAPLAPISDEPAAELIVRMAREHPGLELVAIGPMTNVAHALALDPELPQRVDGLTIMGGHVREARLGSFVCPFGIDYNLCSDPEASAMVLGAGFETTLVTADVTLQVWLCDADVDAMGASGPVARELARQVDVWKPVQHEIFPGMGGQLAPDNAAFLHDPLTVLALLDERPFSFESLRIATTIEGRVLRTHEMPATQGGPGLEMKVATAVDAEAAVGAIVERLRRL